MSTRRNTRRAGEDVELLNVLLQLSKSDKPALKRKGPTKRDRIAKKSKPASPKRNSDLKPDSRILNLDVETEKTFENVQSKIDNFFKMSTLASDSEDDNMGKTSDTEKQNAKKLAPKSKSFYTLSDSEDEDDRVIHITEKPQLPDVAKPSTSAGSNSFLDDSLLNDLPKKIEQNFEKLKSLDDILVDSNTTETQKKTSDKLVNDVLIIDSPKCTQKKRQRTLSVDDILTDIEVIAPKQSQKSESLLDMVKETDEIIGSVSKFLGLEKKEEVVAPTCPVCLESLAGQEVSSTVCGHIFCKPCINGVLKSANKKCPTCRKAINAKKIHPIFL